MRQLQAAHCPLTGESHGPRPTAFIIQEFVQRKLLVGRV